MLYVDGKEAARMAARDRHRAYRIRGRLLPGTPRVGMLTYTALVTLYLLYFGIRGERAAQIKISTLAGWYCTVA